MGLPTDFAATTCVEVAVGPVCVDGSAQTDSMPASCVDSVVGSACVGAAASGGGCLCSGRKALGHTGGRVDQLRIMLVALR